MKKIIALVLVLILGLALLSGCGGDKNSNSTDSSSNNTSTNGNAADYDGSSFGIDLTSTEVQEMSEARATKEKLQEAVWDWLEGITLFLEGTDKGKLTYKDFVDFIGVDATEYYFDDAKDARVYVWIAEDAEFSKVGLWFEKRGGVWCAWMSGASNLGR